MTPERKPWFGPKRFGIGVGPRTWQGVVVILAIVVVVAVIGHFAGAR